MTAKPRLGGEEPRRGRSVADLEALLGERDRELAAAREREAATAAVPREIRPSGEAPTMLDASGRRRFACAPAAVLALVVDAHERILLLAHPAGNGAWKVVNGALEAGETVLDGTLRELREEAGPDLRARPPGAVHVHTHRYDAAITHMISIAYLLAYEGGEVRPGDDMAGSRFRWWSLGELERERPEIRVPRGQSWMLTRAIDLYRLWRDQTVELQPVPDPLTDPKRKR